MARHDMDSATLIEQDRIEAAKERADGGANIVMRHTDIQFGDSVEDAAFTDPGKKYASIKKPKVYEALKKKGYSKGKAARISNAQR